MDPSTIGSELSPLDEIRQAEAEVIRRVAAARQASEATIRKAQAQAADLKRQARDAGHREGQEQYQALTSRTEEEAQALVSEAHRQAKDLRLRGELFSEVAVRWATAIVLGLDEESDDEWNLK